MKKLILLGLAIILFAACQQQEKKRYFSESPEIEAIKANVTQYNNGDWEAWRTHFADTAKLYINSLKSISAADLENAQKELLSNFSSYGFQDEGTFIEMVIDKDDETWVNYWANWHAKFRANDKEIDVPVHFTARFVDGKIVEFHDYFDVSALNNEIMALANMSADEKAMLKASSDFIKAWSDNDFELLKSITSKDIVRVANGETVAKNQDEIGDIMKFWHTTIPDFNLDLKNAVVNGNKTYSSWTSTGTNTGNFGENPPTGKKSITQGFTILTFNNEGKVIHEEAFYDLLSVLNQWGYTMTPPTQ